MPHILRMIVAIRCNTVLVAGSFISSALTHKVWFPTRWALWMTWLTVRSLCFRCKLSLHKEHNQLLHAAQRKM
jgi:hypothetical protein